VRAAAAPLRQTPEALCEERRLFYVAATRAKDRLILTREPGRILDSDTAYPVTSANPATVTFGRR